MRIETYKGIAFVRISEMPKEEQSQVFQTLERDKIIKILRDRELLNDCIQLADYEHWAAHRVALKNAAQPVSVEKQALVRELKLAFK